MTSPFCIAWAAWMSQSAQVEIILCTIQIILGGSHVFQVILGHMCVMCVVPGCALIEYYIKVTSILPSHVLVRYIHEVSIKCIYSKLVQYSRSMHIKSFNMYVASLLFMKFSSHSSWYTNEPDKVQPIDWLVHSWRMPLFVLKPWTNYNSSASI